MNLIRLAALHRYRFIENYSVVFRRYYSQNSINLSEPSVQRYLNYLLSENENLLKKDLKNSFEMKRLCETKSVVSLLVQKVYLDKSLISLKDNHRNEEDEHVKIMIQEEYKTYQKRSKEVDTLLQSVLLEPFLTNSGILLEIVAVDGENSMLFTKELFQMYESYAKYKNWFVDIASMDESEDGFNRASMLIEGMGALEFMNLEKGAHHRISKDDQINRVSIATVTVLVQSPKSEKEIPNSELNVETKEAVNANDDSNYVSIMHTPTGTSVKCKANKSNKLNKYAAMKELRTLVFHNRQVVPIKERKDWSGLIRSDEIIRTYDFSRDRVMEHREDHDGVDFQYQLSTFLEGGEPLDHLQERLLRCQHYQALMKKIKKFDKNVISKTKLTPQDTDLIKNRKQTKI